MKLIHGQRFEARFARQECVAFAILLPETFSTVITPAPQVHAVGEERPAYLSECAVFCPTVCIVSYSSPVAHTVCYTYLVDETAFI